MKSTIFTSLALLLMAGYASAQNTVASAPRLVVLTPDQCHEVWSKAVTKEDSPAQADAAPDIVNFAQLDTDFTQVDANNDGTVGREEFEAACQKGLVHEPARLEGSN